MELALEAFHRFPQNGNSEMIQAYELFLNRRKEIERKHHTLASLKYDEDSMLTLFNETSGPAVEYFWKRIAEEELPYQRKDVLGDVLKRGKIRTRQEYDIVVDTHIPAQQEGRITSEQAEALGSVIEDYENRAAKRR